MFATGTRVGTKRTDRLKGTVVGYGVINAYTLDLKGNPIEVEESNPLNLTPEPVYLVRLDEMINGDFKGSGNGCARVLPFEVIHTFKLNDTMAQAELLNVDGTPRI